MQKIISALKLKFIAQLLFLIALCSCNQHKGTNQSTKAVQEEKVSWIPPKPGSGVDSIREKIKGDPLNNLYFSVVVVSTDSSKEGIYKVKITRGYMHQEVKINLPKWNTAVNLKPVLRKEKKNYQVNLGFVAADTTFYPYYSISATEHEIKMSKDWDYPLRKQSHH